MDIVKKRLAKFKGANRRYQVICDRNKNNDDYGHHPTEINVTIDAAKNVRKKERLR